MSQEQDLGVGGLAYLSTNDLSGTVSDVTNGNSLGTTYKNGIGMAVVADTVAGSVVLQGTGKLMTLGFLQNNPKAGEVANIASIRGRSCKVLAGAAITAGDKLMLDSSARVITATSSVVAIVAIAMEAASAAGNLIEAVLVDGYIA